MKHHYTPEEKAAVITRCRDGTSVSALVKETGIARSTIYLWLRETKKSKSEQEISRLEFSRLKSRAERLETMVEILQSIECTALSPLRVKLETLEKLHEKYNVHIICEALKVSRGTFYNYIYRNKRSNTWYAQRREELRELIQVIYDDSHQIFGPHKVTAVLQSRGQKVSVEYVRGLMQEMGLASIRQDAKGMYDKEKRGFKDCLRQNFKAEKPNEIWVSDVTFFRTRNKSYYICVIIDLFARRVVGYRIGLKNSTHLVKATFTAAYEKRKPKKGLIFHSDRGSNYRSATFMQCLAEHGVVQSNSRPHTPHDNAVMESFFSTMKKEELYRKKYTSEKEFRKSVDEYITFYNEERPHANNGYLTPAQKEKESDSRS